MITTTATGFKVTLTAASAATVANPFTDVFKFLWDARVNGWQHAIFGGGIDWIEFFDFGMLFLVLLETLFVMCGSKKARKHLYWTLATYLIVKILVFCL